MAFSEAELFVRNGQDCRGASAGFKKSSLIKVSLGWFVVIVIGLIAGKSSFKRFVFYDQTLRVGLTFPATGSARAFAVAPVGRAGGQINEPRRWQRLSGIVRPERGHGRCKHDRGIKNFERVSMWSAVFGLNVSSLDVQRLPE